MVMMPQRKMKCVILLLWKMALAAWAAFVGRIGAIGTSVVLVIVVNLKILTADQKTKMIC